MYKKLIVLGGNLVLFIKDIVSPLSERSSITLKSDRKYIICVTPCVPSPTCLILHNQKCPVTPSPLPPQPPHATGCTCSGGGIKGGGMQNLSFSMENNCLQSNPTSWHFTLAADLQSTVLVQCTYTQNLLWEQVLCRKIYMHNLVWLNNPDSYTNEQTFLHNVAKNKAIMYTGKYGTL